MNVLRSSKVDRTETYRLHSAHERVAFRLFLTSWLWLDMRRGMSDRVLTRGGQWLGGS